MNKVEIMKPKAKTLTRKAKLKRKIRSGSEFGKRRASCAHDAIVVKTAVPVKIVKYVKYHDKMMARS